MCPAGYHHPGWCLAVSEAQPAKRSRAAAETRSDRLIASVAGVVGAIAADSLVVEVGGLGYRVFAAPAILARAQTGEQIRLHTFHLVREDQQALYGFASPEDLPL